MSERQNALGWDAIAQRYQTERGWPKESLVWGHRVAPEHELRVLGDVQGKSALVLGCGGGQDCVALKRMGAAEVVGVDLSPKQLEFAARLCERERVEVTLRETSVADLSFRASASVDIVVSVHALQYVERIEACLAETRRVLRARGIFGFSVFHPIDASTSDTAPYGFNKSYFQAETESAWSSLGGGATPLRSYHRTVADWFAVVTQAGFTVESLLEPRPTGDLAWPGPDGGYAQKLESVPGTLIIRARRD